PHYPRVGPDAPPSRPVRVPRGPPRRAAPLAAGVGRLLGVPRRAPRRARSRRPAALAPSPRDPDVHGAQAVLLRDAAPAAGPLGDPRRVPLDTVLAVARVPRQLRRLPRRGHGPAPPDPVPPRDGDAAGRLLRFDGARPPGSPRVRAVRRSPG